MPGLCVSQGRPEADQLHPFLPATCVLIVTGLFALVVCVSGRLGSLQAAPTSLEAQGCTALVVPLPSHGRLPPPIDCSTPGSSVLQHLPEFAQIHVTESVMLSNQLILCHTLLLLPSILPTFRVFTNDSALHISGQGIIASALVLPMNTQE